MVYVETVITAPLDEIWVRTRDPRHHIRWDARFTAIGPYGPDGHFRYATRVLPGLTIAGEGVTAGERRRADGTATSVLRFGSRHPASLIRAGHGYWRFVPAGGATHFGTGYDYRPGWGPLGRIADRAFRPLFAWATAWSFDRLRLWLERGIPPERSRNQAVAEAVVRLAVAGAGLAAGQPLAVAVLLLPPLPGTPAARRCRWSSRASRVRRGREARR
jgi:hypothetical protein